MQGHAGLRVHNILENRARENKSSRRSRRWRVSAPEIMWRRRIREECVGGLGSPWAGRRAANFERNVRRSAYVSEQNDIDH